MSNQRIMKAKETAGDGYAKTNAIAPPFFVLAHELLGGRLEFHPG